MKKFTRWSLLITLMTLILSVVSPALGPIQAVEVKTAQNMLSLGNSLTGQDIERTKSLLGANQVTAANTIYIDGPTVNRYLNDGSNASTNVYSSAYIEPKSPGYGVRVEVVTPDNITQVSNLTYQNAAITSGAKDMLIRIATVYPVTGEGALTGVYALLEKSGLTLDTKSVNVAQKEIKVINDLKDKSKMTDQQANQVIGQIKQQVNQHIHVNQTINDVDIVNIVNQTLVQNNLSIDVDMLNQLIVVIKEYSETDTAQDEEIVDQIDQSIMSGNWRNVLAALEGSYSSEELRNMDRADYSDTSLYHPIIPAFYQTYDQILENSSGSHEARKLYSHTFVLEKMADLNDSSKQALQNLRSLLYYYVASEDDPILPNLVGSLQSVHFPTTKENWLYHLDLVDNHSQDLVLQEIFNQIAIRTGRSPEAYPYVDAYQRDQWIELLFSAQPMVATEFGSVAFNPATSELGYFQMGDDQVTLTNDDFNFQSIYGVAVDNNYSPAVSIPADYTVDERTQRILAGEYVPEEVESSEESDESSEELTDESSSEEVSEELSDESVDESFEESTDPTTESEAVGETAAFNAEAESYDYYIEAMDAGSGLFKGRLAPNATYYIALENVGDIDPSQTDDQGYFEFEITQTELITDGLLVIVYLEESTGWQEAARLVVGGDDALAEDLESQDPVDSSSTEESQEAMAEPIVYSIDPIRAGTGQFRGQLEPNSQYYIEIIGIGEIDPASTDNEGKFEFEINQTDLLTPGTQIKVYMQDSSGNWIPAVSTSVLNADGSEAQAIPEVVESQAIEESFVDNQTPTAPESVEEFVQDTVDLAQYPYAVLASDLTPRKTFELVSPEALYEIEIDMDRMLIGFKLDPMTDQISWYQIRLTEIPTKDIKVVTGTEITADNVRTVSANTQVIIENHYEGPDTNWTNENLYLFKNKYNGFSLAVENESFGPDYYQEYLSVED